MIRRIFFFKGANLLPHWCSFLSSRRQMEPSGGEVSRCLEGDLMAPRTRLWLTDLRIHLRVQSARFKVTYRHEMKPKTLRRFVAGTEMTKRHNSSFFVVPNGRGSRCRFNSITWVVFFFPKCHLAEAMHAHVVGSDRSKRWSRLSVLFYFKQSLVSGIPSLKLGNEVYRHKHREKIVHADTHTHSL